jgi:hypothetical protein
MFFFRAEDEPSDEGAEAAPKRKGWTDRFEIDRYAVTTRWATAAAPITD